MSEAGTYAEGQWAWGTKNVAWKDERNGDRILVVWRHDAWHGVEVGNVWAESQITDVRPVDRPADAVRRVAPYQETREKLREVVAGEVLGGWNEHHCIENQGCTICAGNHAVDALLASGVLGVPAEQPWANADTFDIHVTFDGDASNLIRIEALREAHAIISKRQGTYEAGIDLMERVAELEAEQGA